MLQIILGYSEKKIKKENQTSFPRPLANKLCTSSPRISHFPEPRDRTGSTSWRRPHIVRPPRSPNYTLWLAVWPWNFVNHSQRYSRKHPNATLEITWKQLNNQVIAVFSILKSRRKLQLRRGLQFSAAWSVRRIREVTTEHSVVQFQNRHFHPSRSIYKLNLKPTDEDIRRSYQDGEPYFPCDDFHRSSWRFHKSIRYFH